MMELRDIINIFILAVTAIAVLLGPIAAVKTSAKIESKRERDRRRYNIFHILMKTRKIAMSNEHVMALNLIQLEFKDDKEVLFTYRNYLENLSTPLPADTRVYESFLERRSDLLYELIFAVGQSVGHSIDKKELEKYSYVPVGWANDEDRVRVFQSLMLEVLRGQRPFPVSDFRASEANTRFPPPPQ